MNRFLKEAAEGDLKGTTLNATVYVCPHTPIYMCPHTPICVRILLFVRMLLHVSPYSNIYTRKHVRVGPLEP